MRRVSYLFYSAACLVWIVNQSNPVTPLAARLQPPAAQSVRQSASPAQGNTTPKTPGRELFVSWGYNGDSYTKSDLHIEQTALGNDFTLVDVRIRDSKAWTELFSHSLFVPQYNLRIGYFFNEKWGVELALDHMKWIVREDQQVRIQGTVNGEAVDGEIALTQDVLRYQLNNGANPIFINAIRRVRLVGEPGHTGSLYFLGKAGGGFAVPHTENAVFGQPNEKGFQAFHGWNLDAVAAARLNLPWHLYFEFEEKLVYARYFGVNVDRGKAKHSLKANEFTLNLGVAFK